MKPSSVQIEPIFRRSHQYATAVGAVAAVAAIIYGIAINLMRWIVMGAIFLTIFSSHFYELHQASLNCANRDAQIDRLTKKVHDLSEKCATLENFEKMAAENQRQAMQSNDGFASLFASRTIGRRTRDA